MSLVHAFTDEIEEIENEKLRSLLVDGLDSVPEFYENLSSHIEVMRRAFEYAKVFCDVLNSEDDVRETVLVGALLQDITRFYLDEDGDVVEDDMHPLTVRKKLLPSQLTAGRDLFDDVMRVIESSHGLNSIIPQVVPSMVDNVHLWILPFVDVLAEKEE